MRRVYLKTMRSQSVPPLNNTWFYKYLFSFYLTFSQKEKDLELAARIGQVGV